MGPLFAGRSWDTVGSQKLEHGCRMIDAGFPSFFGLALDDGHVPTFWLRLSIGLNRASTLRTK